MSPQPSPHEKSLLLQSEREKLEQQIREANQGLKQSAVGTVPGIFAEKHVLTALSTTLNSQSTKGKISLLFSKTAVPSFQRSEGDWKRNGMNWKPARWHWMPGNVSWMKTTKTWRKQSKFRFWSIQWHDIVLNSWWKTCSLLSYSERKKEHNWERRRLSLIMFWRIKCQFCLAQKCLFIWWDENQKNLGRRNQDRYYTNRRMTFPVYRPTV